MGELTASAEKGGIGISCIQEHRIFHDFDIKHHDIKNKWVLLTNSEHNDQGCLNATESKGIQIFKFSGNR